MPQEARMSETTPEPVDTSAADPDPITTDISQDPKDRKSVV